MANICPQTYTIRPPSCLYLHIDDFPELQKIAVNSNNAVEFKFLECVCVNTQKCSTYSNRNKKTDADIYYNEKLGNARIEHYFIIFYERNVNMEVVIDRLKSSIAQMNVINKIQLVIVVGTFSSGIEMVNIQGEYHKLLNKHFGNAVDIKVCPFKPKLRKYLELLDSNPLFLT